MRGELADAIGHAESWILDAPQAMNARRTLLELVAMRGGPDAWAERARAWMCANPGHEEFEDAYGAALGQAGAPRWKKDVIYRRRARRNPDDALALLEMASTALQVYAGAAEHRRAKLVPRVEALLAGCERTAAGSTPTLRAQAWWSELRGDWAGAVSKWLEVNEREPVGNDSCRRAWECSARLPDAERRRVWNQIRPRLLGAQGHLSIARDVMALLVERFGVSEANKELEQLRLGRPDDPCVLEAAVDRLLEHGRGRSDAQRALALDTPAADRFHHLGLRFSLASAYRLNGNVGAAESVLLDIVRRHPGNPAAQIQLAWAKLHGGDQDAACQLLESAAASAPQNPDVLTTQAAILHQCRGVDEARAAIAQGLTRMGHSVAWRTTAVGLLLEWGAVEEALAAAQQGVTARPRNAALWLLLGRTMGQLRRQFTIGEVESCLRTSLAHDAGLFESSDLLACCLADRERYDDAIQVLQAVETRMADPSPARCRLAWVERRRTKGAKGLDAMTAVVATAPWCEWGWLILADWLEEDRDWQRARLLFDRVPEQMAHSLRFRQRRLQILKNAGVDLVRVNAEWNALLRDYPDNEALRAARSSWLREVQPPHAVSEASVAPGIPPWAWGVLAMIAVNLLRACQGP
jgi:tetratricopeptide (TPR) repeat protein